MRYGDCGLRVTIRPIGFVRTWLGPSASAAVVGLGVLWAAGTVAAAEPVRGAAPGYFIEFRARPSAYFGHTFIVYGRVDGSGRTVERHHAGFVPGDDFLMALILPVRGTVGPDRDDWALQSTATYRRRLSAIEYRRVAATVGLLRATHQRWHFFFFNCNDFAIEIAEALNLHRLPSLVPPKLWVEGLSILNGD